jgi:hypothetical protein
MAGKMLSSALKSGKLLSQETQNNCEDTHTYTYLHVHPVFYLIQLWFSVCLNYAILT